MLDRASDSRRANLRSSSARDQQRYMSVEAINE